MLHGFVGAAECGDERLTYLDLTSRAFRLARHLRSLGADREVRVALCLRRSPDLLVAIVGVLAAGWLRHLGVDGSQARGGQTGARGEAGLRFEGGAGAAELFAAVERRIDPYPLEFGSATWISAGFRLLTR